MIGLGKAELRALNGEVDLWVLVFNEREGDIYASGQTTVRYDQAADWVEGIRSDFVLPLKSLGQGGFPTEYGTVEQTTKKTTYLEYESEETILLAFDNEKDYKRGVIDVAKTWTNEGWCPLSVVKLAANLAGDANKVI